MHKVISNCFLLFVITALTLFTLASCNNQVEIPFPISDSAYPQPVSQPLQLSAPKKVNWLTAKTGGVKSVVKKLDVDALPAVPFDTAGFKPFSNVPEQVHFDFNTLPDMGLNLEKIPSKSFHFKSTVLASPVVVKAGVVVPKKGTNISIADIGLAQGLPDKIIICIIQDKNGFIWIGTDKAFYRYDGESMLSYLTASRGIFDIIESGGKDMVYKSGAYRNDRSK